MAVNPQIKTLDLRPPKAPNLLIAPVDYAKLYQDQLNNALRLYFNQIDNFAFGLTSGTGGSAIKFPYFSAYQNGHTELTAAIPNVSSTAAIQVTSTAEFSNSGLIIVGEELISYTTKTATTFDGTIVRGVFSSTKSSHAIGTAVSEAARVPSATSSAAATLDTITLSNGITCTVPDSRIYFDTTANYNIQFSAQFLNYTTNEDNITFWLSKNGTDEPNSASIQQVNSKHGSNPGAGILTVNFVDTFKAGDYVELYWASKTGETVLATFPPGTSPTRPASPSLIVTITFVSAV